jgi:hypothetical protein
MVTRKRKLSSRLAFFPVRKTSIAMAVGAEIDPEDSFFPNPSKTEPLQTT